MYIIINVYILIYHEIHTSYVYVGMKYMYLTLDEDQLFPQHNIFLSWSEEQQLYPLYLQSIKHKNDHNLLHPQNV